MASQRLCIYECLAASNMGAVRGETRTVAEGGDGQRDLEANPAWQLVRAVDQNDYDVARNQAMLEVEILRGEISRNDNDSAKKTIGRLSDYLTEKSSSAAASKRAKKEAEAATKKNDAEKASEAAETPEYELPSLSQVDGLRKTELIRALSNLGVAEPDAATRTVKELKRDLKEALNDQ